jgi:ABC-type phosphate/phosphonate transport system permease subunit
LSHHLAISAVQNKVVKRHSSGEAARRWKWWWLSPFLTSFFVVSSKQILVAVNLNRRCHLQYFIEDFFEYYCQKKIWEIC